MEALRLDLRWWGIPGHQISSAESGAIFSPERLHRYALWRDLHVEGPPLVVIGLNPSTADETRDDPTIRRCRGFAKAWGFEGLVMLNLYAFRSTDPKPMFAAGEAAVGPDNDATILQVAKDVRSAGGVVLAAWGAFRQAVPRATLLREKLREAEVTLHVLGLSKEGGPKHPLYIKADTLPREWNL